MVLLGKYVVWQKCCSNVYYLSYWSPIIIKNVTVVPKLKWSICKNIVRNLVKIHSLTNKVQLLKKSRILRRFQEIDQLHLVQWRLRLLNSCRQNKLKCSRLQRWKQLKLIGHKWLHQCHPQHQMLLENSIVLHLKKILELIEICFPLV